MRGDAGEAVSHSIDQHYGAEDQEHCLGKMEMLCQNHAQRDQNKSDALCGKESRGRQMNTSDAEDVSRIAFASPVFFGDMN